MNCSSGECGAPLPLHERFCVACGKDAGAPNVRKANDPAEIAAVELRYSEQLARARDGGYGKAFDKFEQEAAESTAVVCMPSGRLLSLATDPNSLLSTFGLQIEGQSRVPQDNRFDNIRSSVEEAYFPNYSKFIRFAALSLSSVGHAAYGSCSISLKESAIIDRASLFEYPLFEFAEKFAVGLSKPIPFGHRATWGRRGRLAAAKLGSKLAVAGASNAEVLLPAPLDTLADCIEVHIYGPLNRYSFQKVVMLQEKRREDRAIQRAIFESLQRENVDVELVA